MTAGFFDAQRLKLDSIKLSSVTWNIATDQPSAKRSRIAKQKLILEDIFGAQL
jgi:hypothetical protein